MRPRRSQILGACLTLSLIGACSTSSQGMGGGELAVAGRPSQPVLFTWQSQDGGISGTLVAALPNATYTGAFMQVTTETERSMLLPLWSGWDIGWADWPYWTFDAPSADRITRFTREYSGKVVATLQDPGGQRMRCRFHMDVPAAGMAGGGQGECQLAGGKVVAAVINRS